VIQKLLLSVLLWQTPSFIEQSIVSAKEAIAKEPNQAEGYNDLAHAYVRKVRETGDLSFADRAEEAISKSLKFEAANFGARRARVAVRLAQHRYADALEEAEALRKQRPDDNPIYSYISDADLGLGDYHGAELAVQRMLDLRSVNGPGYEAGAVVREMIGYPDAALEWWQSALHLISDRDKEERAYVLSHMAHIYRETGKYDRGGESAERALQLQAGYPAAISELARIRIEQNRNAEAIQLLRAKLATGTDLDSLYWLVVALEQSKADAVDAVSAGKEFEKSARQASDKPFNVNPLLVRYLAAHERTGEAISMAKLSLERRDDLLMRQAYAMALLSAGNSKEALSQIRQALKPGLLDTRLYFEAGMIAKQEKAVAAAEGYFKKAFEIGSGSCYSVQIVSELAALRNLK
jgi:predicted Zn-dependent protease